VQGRDETIVASHEQMFGDLRQNKLKGGTWMNKDLPTISTGEVSNLRTYRNIASFFGEEAVEFIDEKIKESPNGEEEIVIAPEFQMMVIFNRLVNKREKAR
jgi:hypothetical protein